MCPGMHTPSYEGTPPVVDAAPPVHMRPGMHTPRYEGTPPVVDGLILTYTSGVVESITLQIEDFIPPDHTRANYAGLVLHGAHR